MYNLLIVDDELTIRNGLKSTLDWASLGIEVVGDVRHGQEALDFMAEHTVHIVITDIRMPIMDGMALTKRLNELYPDVRMVILSGYDDFEYARQALKHNVKDYLLKPFSLDKLTDLMSSLCCDLDELYAHRENSRLNRSLLSDSLHDIRFRFFQKLTGHPVPDDADLPLLDRLGFPRIPSSCYMVLCQSEDSENEGGSDTDDDLHMIAEILDESNLSDSVLTPFLTAGKRLAILTGSDIPVDTLLEEIMRISGRRVFLGIGSAGDTWAHMKQSLDEAGHTFRVRPFFSSGLVLEYEKLPEQYKCDVTVPPDLSQRVYTLTLRLSEYLLASDLGQGLECLGSILELFRGSYTDFMMFRQEVVKIIIVNAWYLKRQGVDTGNFYSSYSPVLDSTADLQNTDQLERWARHIISDFCKRVNESLELKFKPLVKKAVNYMEENYSSPLRIEEVAAFLNISPNYLSRVFKEETGVSMLTWLNAHRVDKAEKLLEDPALKIYEISETIGFSDYRYFNKVFKKIKGLSPREYRNSAL